MKKRLGLGLLTLVAGLALLDLFDVPSRARDMLERQLTGRDAPASALRAEHHSRRRMRIWPAEGVSLGKLAEGMLRVAPDESSVLRGFELAQVGIGRERRLAMGGALPHSGTATLALPTGSPLLRFAIDHADGGLRGEVHYALRISPVDEGSGTATTIFEVTRPVHATGWQSHSVDLSRWQGRRVQLHFDASFAAGDPTSLPSAFWGNVSIHTAGNGSRPNLVVILIDTLRADHLGSYGYERDTSPFMDSLAHRGVRFDRAISTAPWTDPAVLSLMTGLYPSDLWEVGSRRNVMGRGFPEAVESFPESLAAAGYQTIAVVDHPSLVPNRFGQGFDIYRMLSHGNAATITTPPYEVLRVVERLLRESGDSVFLYLHLLYPHLPYEAPEGYHGLFGPGEREEVRDNRVGLLNLYDSQIRLSDDVVAALMSVFESQGLADDFVLAIVSDHGEAFWDHDLFAHGNSLYNELLRIPLLLYGPGRIPEGLVVEDVVQIVDLGPTLLELAGVAVPPDKRGVSFVPTLTGGPSARDFAFSEFPYRGIPFGQALQTRNTKLIIDEPGAAAHHFDLQADPAENEPGEARTGETAALLHEQASLQRSLVARRAASAEASVEAPSPSTVEQLRALGYTD